MNLIQRMFLLWLGIIALLSYHQSAQAVITCSVSSPGFNAGYVPSNTTTSVTSTTFDVTCTRDNQGGPATATVQYNMSVNNGINPLGTQNRAVRAGNFLNYHLATDSACAIQWSGATTIPSNIYSFSLPKNSTVTNTFVFYGCILPGLATLPTEGIYTDTVTLIFTPGKATGASSFIGSSFPVAIVAPATCNITTLPSNINFSYTAFSPAPVLANASIGVKCSVSLAYSITLDTNVGVLTGLNYTLALNTTANTGGLNPLTSVGTGVPQTFFINGNMGAGQAGACNSSAAACTGSHVHTLTVTY